MERRRGVGRRAGEGQGVDDKQQQQVDGRRRTLEPAAWRKLRESVRSTKDCTVRTKLPSKNSKYSYNGADTGKRGARMHVCECACAINAITAGTQRGGLAKTYGEQFGWDRLALEGPVGLIRRSP